MVERNRNSGFTLEPKDRLFVASKLGPQNLDGDVAPHGGLVRAIDGPHPAGADLLLDAKLLEQNRPKQRVRDFVVGDEQAAVVRAILGSVRELRTAAKANLPHVGQLP